MSKIAIVEMSDSDSVMLHVKYVAADTAYSRPDVSDLSVPHVYNNTQLTAHSTLLSHGMIPVP